ncbi:hypothetical protein VC83_00136 [Pseudogymnoascus destructans]|uniref:Uncharacterized protein n=1 Tax=Pseudogymnoascus destructans TaxID=655981 RepID=A0A177AMW5_9PEZI|nr:uncharacterized protein VC83_00136 [Pseudogymnoascus destructans]OAF63378.1 hypothetical protein VC83_00136 [Pseudogymnoascus destructans]
MPQKNPKCRTIHPPNMIPNSKILIAIHPSIFTNSRPYDPQKTDTEPSSTTQKPHILPRYHSITPSQHTIFTLHHLHPSGTTSPLPQLQAHISDDDNTYLARTFPWKPQNDVDVVIAGFMSSELNDGVWSSPPPSDRTPSTNGDDLGTHPKPSCRRRGLCHWSSAGGVYSSVRTPFITFLSFHPEYPPPSTPRKKNDHRGIHPPPNRDRSRDSYVPPPPPPPSQQTSSI